MNKQFTYWLMAFFASSLFYFFIRTIENIPFEWIPKVIPIILLIGLAFKALHGKTQKLILAALIFSLGGDILLSWPDLFVPGLGSFLLAQIIYTMLFSAQFAFSRRGMIWGGFILIYAFTALTFIVPKAGDFSGAVIAYLCAISCMAISAGFRQDKQFLLVALGAFVFMVSDTLIAVNKFVQPFPYAGVAIMITYYLAQLMISLGIIRHCLSLKNNT